ncbi:MAG: discoidin domain-containing protein, partial [Planctomycetales bacterium]
GTFFDRDIHERDRRAKYGNKPIPKRGKVNSIPTEGLLDRTKLKITRASSESSGNQKRAANAIDGDSRTHWHTSFSPEVDKHPHELVIDLGDERSVSGVRYLARQDGGWNGALAKCEFFVGNTDKEFGESVATTTFRKLKTSQEATWQPVSGRYVLVRILSEVNGGPWASISELGIVGK